MSIKIKLKEAQSHLKTRLMILKYNFVYSFQEQTAYFFENWFSLASTTAYTLALLLFIKILFYNVKTFAGYNENEMLLLMLFSQAQFYVNWTWSSNNIYELIHMVRTGSLDFLLVKPLPAMFFVTFRKISLISRLKDAVPNLIVLSFVINWTEIAGTTVLNVLSALVIFILGQICWHCFRFLFALPVFFIGQSTHIFHLSGTLGETSNLPYEGFPKRLRWALTYIAPSLITAQLSVSVLLGKSPALTTIISIGFLAVVLLILKGIGWNIAIRNYSSASS